MKVELLLIIIIKLHLVSGSDSEPYLNVGNNLTSVPVNIPDDVNIINLSNNEINNLLPEDFQNFNALTEINLTSNKITWIDDGLFSPTIHSNLEVILLSDNVIETMPSLNGFNSLRTLDVSINLLQNFTVGNLSSLKNLDVSYNNLNEMPVLTNILSTLKVFRITNNNVTSVPLGYFDKTPALEELDLKLNHIREISLGNLFHLVSLNLFNNDLQNMPRITQNLTSLRTMVLDSNEISQIPEGYFNKVPLLQKLIMSNNPLVTFNCSGLSNLKELRLNKTIMNEFPNITDCFQSLVILYFEGLRETLQIKGIEKSLVFGSTLTPVKSESLTQLELRRTYIGDLPSWFLFSLPNLERLDIATTELTEMPDISTNTE